MSTRTYTHLPYTARCRSAFRTDWARRSMQESGTPIGDYDEGVGTRQTLIKEFADHLPGVPRKVAEAVLTVTTLEEPPLRLLLGRGVRSEEPPSELQSLMPISYAVFRLTKIKKSIFP